MSNFTAPDIRRRQPPSTPHDVGHHHHDTSPKGSKDTHASRPHHKTDRGVSRITQAFRSKAEQRVARETAEGHRKTVNEVIREKSEPQRRDREQSTSVDGPNLVTHLPDVVVHSDYRHPLPLRISNQAVLLFLDISGFTKLCEKYSQAAKTGTEQLTKTLNGYMSALVSEIISYDGDILKFAGDAILSMWPVDSLRSMAVAVENVIQCALDIQNKHGTYTTNDGVTLKVKIGIAAGEIHIIIIGNNEERTYIEVGRGIEDVNKAENMCEKGGDVVVSPGAWIHCPTLPSDHVQIQDSKFIKVTHLHTRVGIGYKTERTIAVTAEMENLDRSIRNLIVPSEMIIEHASSKPVGPSDSYARSETTIDESRRDREELAVGSGNLYRLRKTVITHFSRNKVDNLKLFISKPVLRKIEDGQPLEYLSEMRQVTMLFINLDIDKSTKYGYLVLMQRCYEVIHANTKRMRGCISKVFAFDKGCTFMVIFGLPGYKHENDSAHALNCAHSIFTELNRIVGLKQTSIGVTTGPTYCGIVGHNHRHEYTVIGRRVNMGARLMMHYRGKVICDNTTFYYSKLNESYFIVQEAKEMKGLQQVGTVREFRPKINLKDAMDQIRLQEEQKPIIGRDDELASFEQCLDRLLALDEETQQERAPAVMIIGETGMGRTRLLNAFMAAALRRSITVTLCTLAIGNINISYYVVRSLLGQLLKAHTIDREAREELMKEMFSNNEVLLKSLHLIDAVLDVEAESESEQEIPPIDEIMKVLRPVLRHFAERNTAIIFAIDDVRLMDEYSWQCIHLFNENVNTMLLMTHRIVLDKDIDNEIIAKMIKDPQNLIIHCSGLSVFHFASIACQFLNVARIPDSLDHVLRLNSMGIPSWIDLLLREYLYEAVIKIEPTLIYNHTETMVAPAPRDLQEHKSDRNEEHVIDELVSRSETNFVDELMLDAVSPTAEQVCFMLIQQTDDLKVPTSIASMIQARIDHMKEVDQTVLKGASIIGQFVFREILQHMLQAEVNKTDLADSIQRLADSGAFSCASSAKKHRGRAGVAGLGGAFSGQTCTCLNEERAMKDCRVLMFLSASLRLTAYEMMLEQNRRPLHMAAAHFLEEKIRRLSSHDRTMNERTLYESYVHEDIEDETSSTSSKESNVEGMTENEVEGEEDGDDINSNEKPPRRQEKEECEDDEECEESVEERPAKSGRLGTRKVSKKDARRVSPLKQPHSQRLKTIIGAETQMRRQSPSMFLGSFSGKDQVKGKQNSKDAQDIDATIISMNLANMSESIIINYTGHERLAVLRIQYPQIAEQYRGAGNTQNTVFYLTEAAAACLALFDYSGAITHLREANRIFSDLKRGRNPFEGRVANLDNWKPEPYDEGQMESLIGQTLFGMEKSKKAVPHFQLALKLLGSTQERKPMRMKMATAFLQAAHVKRGGGQDHHVSSRQARLLTSQAQCLFYLFEDYVSRGDLVGAKYAAVQQVAKTELANDLLGQIEAATCMLKLAHLQDDVAGIYHYETAAKIKSVVAMQNMRNDQMIRLTKLYWTSFEVHLARSPVSDAVEAGMAASRLMMAVRGTMMQLHMLASLAKSLIYTDRVKDAVDVLDTMQSDAGSSESKCWYFCGCMHLVLTIGVRLALVEDCISYSDEVLAQRMFTKRPQLLFAFACSFCLYYKRVRSEDRFEEWRKVATKNEPQRYDNFIAAVGFFELLECKLLQLSRLIGEMRRAMAIGRLSGRRTIIGINQSDRRYLERVISNDFAFAGRIVRRLVSLEPRFLILQAYHAAILDRMNQARNLLQNAVRRADDTANISHSRWAKHNHEVWFGERATAGGTGGEEEDEVGVVRHSFVSAGSSGGAPSGSQIDRSMRRRTAASRGSFSTAIRHGSELPGDQFAPRRHRRSGGHVSTWLHERGLSQATSAIVDGVTQTGDVHNQWLKSANTTFPFWYILNHVRNETRVLLYFSLPLPEWFAIHWF